MAWQQCRSLADVRFASMPSCEFQTTGPEAFMSDPEMPEMAAAMLRSVVTMANVARPGADGSAPAAVVVSSPFPNTDAAHGAQPATAAATSSSTGGGGGGGGDRDTSPPLQQQHPQQSDVPARVAAPLVVQKKKKKKKHRKSKSDANQPEVEAAKAELLKTLGLDDGAAAASPIHPTKTPSGFTIPTSSVNTGGYKDYLATTVHREEMKESTPPALPTVVATALPSSAEAEAAVPALLQVRLVPEAVGTEAVRGAEDAPTHTQLLLSAAAPPAAPAPALLVLSPPLPTVAAASTATATTSPPVDSGTPINSTAINTASLSPKQQNSPPTTAAASTSTPPPVDLLDAQQTQAQASTLLDGAHEEAVPVQSNPPSTRASSAAATEVTEEPPALVPRQVSDDTAAILQTHDQILSGKAGRADRMAAALAALDGHLTTAEVETVAIAQTALSEPSQGSPATVRARTAATSFSAIRKEQMDKVAEQRKQDESIAKEVVSHEVMIKVGSSRHQVWKTVDLPEPDLHIESTPQNPQEASWKTTFETKVVGTTLTVSRTDRKIGWSQPLVLKATRGAVVPLPADLTGYSGPSPLQEEAHGWKARAGRAEGSDGYRFGDLTRTTVAGGKKLMHGVTDGIASALSKVVHAGSGGRLGDSGSSAGASDTAGSGGAAGAAASSGGGTESDGWDDFDLLTEGPGGSDGVVSVNYDEQTSLEMLGKITLLRPVVDLEKDQMCECAHCKSKIPIIDPDNKTEFARRCEYDGKWYCAECHINDEAIIPAIVLHKGEAALQLVSRRAKQFLGLIDTEPVLMVEMIEYDDVPGAAVGPAPPQLVLARLEKLEKALKRISGVRTSLKSLKERMLQDPRVNATELRQKLWPREHLWDETSLWTMQDLREVATHLQTKSGDTMVPLERKLRDLVIQFQKHIAKQKGKGAMIKRW